MSKGEIYKDFEKVREEIEIDTKRVAGASKGISSLPVVVKIYSDQLINLSLIDLPGLAKVNNKIKISVFIESFRPKIKN